MHRPQVLELIFPIRAHCKHSRTEEGSSPWTQEGTQSPLSSRVRVPAVYIHIQKTQRKMSLISLTAYNGATKASEFRASQKERAQEYCSLLVFPWKVYVTLLSWNVSKVSGQCPMNQSNIKTSLSRLKKDQDSLSLSLHSGAPDVNSDVSTSYWSDTD